MHIVHKHMQVLRFKPCKAFEVVSEHSFVLVPWQEVLSIYSPWQLSDTALSPNRRYRDSSPEDDRSSIRA